MHEFIINSEAANLIRPNFVGVNYMTPERVYRRQKEKKTIKEMISTNIKTSKIIEFFYCYQFKINE